MLKLTEWHATLIGRPQNSITYIYESIDSYITTIRHTLLFSFVANHNMLLAGPRVVDLDDKT